MRLHAHSSLLCVVDIQERLLTAIPAGPQVVVMAGRLADAAALLGVRTLLTEQYPQGLGPTPPDLAAKLPPALTKMAFSCCGSEAFTETISADIESALLCGLETHVCIQQTALDLLARGLTVFIAGAAASGGLWCASHHHRGRPLRMVRLRGASAVSGSPQARTRRPGFKPGLITVKGSTGSPFRRQRHPRFPA